MPNPVIKTLGLAPYDPIWQKMRTFTLERDNNTPDEIWLVEHTAVFTQGTAGKAEHVLDPHDIPVVMSDRGGQVTYHAPGQLVIYFMLNLRRLNMGIRSLVSLLEQSVMDCLNDLGISNAHRKTGAPGVYVAEEKICFIGLRVRKGFTYHGIAFNLDMDLTPFSYIHPCGYENLKVTQLHHLLPDAKLTGSDILPYFLRNLGYNDLQRKVETPCNN